MLRSQVVASAAPRGILCDLDGVIYESGSAQAIPGAAETFEYFRSRGVPWLFVTNTTTQPREGLAQRLRGLGLPAREGDILSPAKLAADWLRANPGCEPVALFVAPELAPEFGGLALLGPGEEGGAGAVVVGDMGTDWDYSQLNRAFRLLMEGQMRAQEAGAVGVAAAAAAAVESGAAGDGGDVAAAAAAVLELEVEVPVPAAGCTASGQAVTGNGAGSHVPAGGVQAQDGAVGRPSGPVAFLSLGKGRYFKDRDGLSLDAGPFTAALEYATDMRALVLGKPDPRVFALAAAALGLRPEEVVMVGDDVRGDVGAAQAAGLRGLLVRTGKFRAADLAQGVVPDAVLGSVADLPAWWEGQRGEGQAAVDAEQQAGGAAAGGAAGGAVGWLPAALS